MQPASGGVVNVLPGRNSMGTQRHSPPLLRPGCVVGSQKFPLCHKIRYPAKEESP